MRVNGEGGEGWRLVEKHSVILENVGIKSGAFLWLLEGGALSPPHYSGLRFLGRQNHCGRAADAGGRMADG